MKPLIMFCVLIAAVEARANPCGEIVVNKQRFVQTEFAQVVGLAAVPVATIPTVAPYANYWYSYNQYAPQATYGQQQSGLIAKQIAAEVLKELRAPNGQQQGQFRANAAPQTMLALKCARCHSGGEPKGGLLLTDLAGLTAEQKNKAINMIVTDRMPKGGPPLKPEEAGKIITELTTPVASSQPTNAGPPAQPGPQGQPPAPPNPEPIPANVPE